MRRGLSGVLLVMASITACSSSSSFRCRDAAQCGEDAFCEANGYCSFPDESCDSGRRYGEFTESGLAFVCVEESTVGGSTEGTGSETYQGDVGLGSSGPPQDATTGIDATSGNDSTDDPLSGVVTFEDDFDRPNASDLGRDWVEKNPDAFAIEMNRVVKNPDALSDYHIDLVHRPISESIKDGLIDITVRFTDVDTPGFPQIMSRLQLSSETLDLRGYVCFLTMQGTALRIRRMDGPTDATDVDLLTMPLFEPLEIDTDYRLRMVIAGDGPVQLQCILERIEDANIVGAASTLDFDSEAVVEPGMVGFSAADQTSNNFSYDDFVVQALSD